MGPNGDAYDAEKRRRTPRWRSSGSKWMALLVLSFFALRSLLWTSWDISHVPPELTISPETAQAACDHGTSDSLQKAWNKIDERVALFSKGSKVKVSGGIFLYPRQASLLTSIVSALASSLQRPLRVCETGFGSGHSAALFLEASPNVHVYSFDKFDRTYQLPNWRELNETYVNQEMRYYAGDSCKTVPRELNGTALKCDILHGSSLCPTDNLDLVKHSPCGILLTSTAMNELEERAVYFGKTAQWRRMRNEGSIQNISCFSEAVTTVERDFVFGKKGDVISHKFCFAITANRSGVCENVGDIANLLRRIELRSFCQNYQVPVPD